MRHLGGLTAISLATLLTAACGGGSTATDRSVAPASTTIKHSAASPKHGHRTTANRHSTPTSRGQAAPRASTTSAPAGRGNGSSGGGATQHDDASAQVVPMVAAGDYVYQAEGHAQTAVGDRDYSGRSHLTVTAPAPNRRHATLRGDDGTSEQTIVGRTDGLYLADIKMSQRGFSTEFRPASPVLLMPAGAHPGHTWSWDMTSTDGSYTLHGRLRLTDDEGTATVSGKPARTVTVKSVLVIEGDSLSMTMHQTDMATTDGLVVREHVRGDGTAYGTPVHTEGSRRLTSAG